MHQIVLFCVCVETRMCAIQSKVAGCVPSSSVERIHLWLAEWLHVIHSPKLQFWMICWNQKIVNIFFLFSFRAIIFRFCLLWSCFSLMSDIRPFYIVYMLHSKGIPKKYHKNHKHSNVRTPHILFLIKWTWMLHWMQNYKNIYIIFGR